MSIEDTFDYSSHFLDALRRVGVIIPDSPPIEIKAKSVRLSLSVKSFWLVQDGYFECCIDERDASTAEQALDIAHTSLECWHFIGHRGEGIGSVTRISRDQYVDWLRSHQ